MYSFFRVSKIDVIVYLIIINQAIVIKNKNTAMCFPIFEFN